MSLILTGHARETPQVGKKGSNGKPETGQCMTRCTSYRYRSCRPPREPFRRDLFTSSPVSDEWLILCVAVHQVPLHPLRLVSGRQALRAEQQR